MYYAEIRTSRIQFDCLLRTTSREGAERLVKREIAKRSAAAGVFFIESESDTGRIRYFNLYRMKDDKEYWNERMRLTDNGDGSFIITDKKKMVCVRFPSWLCSEKEQTVTELYGNTSAYDKELSRRLILKYKENFGAYKARKAMKVVRKPYYRIEGVAQEFDTLADVRRYVGTYGDANMNYKSIIRVTPKRYVPEYIVIWEERFGLAKIERL